MQQVSICTQIWRRWRCELCSYLGKRHPAWHAEALLFCSDENRRDEENSLRSENFLKMFLLFRYIHESNETHKINVSSSMVLNSLKVETTQMFLSRWTDKQNVVTSTRKVNCTEARVNFEMSTQSERGQSQPSHIVCTHLYEVSR